MSLSPDDVFEEAHWNGYICFLCQNPMPINHDDVFVNAHQGGQINDPLLHEESTQATFDDLVYMAATKEAR
jgi:hypothetical protein